MFARIIYTFISWTGTQLFYRWGSNGNGRSRKGQVRAEPETPLDDKALFFTKNTKHEKASFELIP